MQFAPWNYRSAAPPRPAEIIALGDQPVDIFEFMLTAEGYGVWTNGTQTNWWKAPNHKPARGYRHNKHQSCNMAFMDGHVDQLQTAALMRESGRWFWWDAIRGDTANDSGGSGGSPTGTMPQTPTPNPSPNTPSGGGPITGPLTAPCGCPPPCKPASTPPPPALPLQFRHTG
jgi:prepilin-type processing-associated H-X9-DG protein